MAFEWKHCSRCGRRFPDLRRTGLCAYCMMEDKGLKVVEVEEEPGKTVIRIQKMPKH